MLLTDALHMLETHQPGPPSSRANWFRVNLTSGHRDAVCTRADLGGAVDMLLHDVAAAARSGLTVSLAVTRPMAHLSGRVRSLLAELVLPAAQLELQVSVPFAAECTIDDVLELSKLRDSGVGLALTQAGRDTVPLLDRWPATTLILPPARVCGPARDPAAIATIRSHVAAAHARGITVVATGIETEAERALLSGLGCDAGEGELFGG